MPPTAHRPEPERTPPARTPRRRWGRWLAGAVSLAVLVTSCGGGPCWTASATRSAGWTPSTGRRTGPPTTG
ncbi:hypothetical protein ACFQ0T_25915 [Kitasatospora gansuensis]